MHKILILAANPKDQTRQRLSEEVRDIEEGLQRSRLRAEFELAQRWAVRPRDMQRAMLDENPQIVHFTGQSDGEAGLFLESVTGEAQLVTGEALAGLFALFSDTLQCVVMNGCYSEAQAQEISQHVPYVIGMTAAIARPAALEFAVGFYDALAAGRSIDQSFKLGCAAMAMSGTGGNDKPVLLKAAGADAQSSTTAGQSSASSSAAVSSVAQPSVVQPSKTAKPPAAVTVFFSYAHEDEGLRDNLATHLKLLERTKVIESWHDRQILPGQAWDGAINENLNSAQIILLLVSSDFLASDYCWDVEIAKAIERHDEGDACVIPIILRTCDWFAAPFGKLQALPKNAKPVTTWDDQDQAFTDIAKGIRKVAESFRG